MLDTQTLHETEVMTTIRDGISVIFIDHPPVNSLTLATRRRLIQELDIAQRDPTIRAIVVAGGDRVFSAGADIAEIGTPAQLQEPTLRTLVERLESSSKPVVAAIAGVALGGGLELALACHSRVAHVAARLGLPEVKLGLIPGCGGTQRLPRLIGAEQALEMMLTGEVSSTEQVQALFDEVTTGDVVKAACDWALALANGVELASAARDRTVDATELQATLDAYRVKFAARLKSQPVYAALIDAVAASALPFDVGLHKERELFLTLVGTPASRAQRHLFNAERKASRLPADLQAEARTVVNLAVIGAGTMGSGIAISALDAGLSVLLLEQDEQALSCGKGRILKHYQGRVAAGKVDEQVASSNCMRLTVTTDWTRIVEADLVIEAVFEDLAVKQEVFRRIDANARPGAVLATNTSYLDVDAIAEVTSRPADVLGLHFFSPAQVMKLLEVVGATKTAPDVVATGMALGRALRKTPVRVGNAFGFIGNRIYDAYRRQCEFMLEDGAWPEDIDGALRAFGFPMGPFAVADLSGLDIAWRMRKARAAQRDPGDRYVAVLDWLCERGRLGRKSGAGYYTYVNDKPSPNTDSVVRELIEEASALRGIQRRPLAPEDIQRRAVVAMVNEALLLLAEGVASCAGDVDVVMTQGYGFPRWEGGPMHWALHQDHGRLAGDLDQLAKAGGRGFARGDLSLLSTLLRGPAETGPQASASSGN